MVRQHTSKHNLAFFIFQPSPLYFWSYPCRAVATNEKQANYYAAPNQQTINQYVVPLLWCLPARHRIEMALRHRGAHGDKCEVQCVLAVRKKPSFTHVRDNLRGAVSGKRFSTHAIEKNVAKIGDGGCGDDKGIESASGE